MNNFDSSGAPDQRHHHVFLGKSHASNERKTWAVIWLCGIMMLAEIIGGSLFGSLALVADGLHMSTHAGALLIAALAYTYSRRHANDARFVFGTGKLGDLAGFTSAIVLAMIALLIGYEAVVRLLSPVAINFNEAIPIAVVGLFVNLASAWLLSGDDHHGHAHGHGHGHGHGSAHKHDEAHEDGNQHAHDHAHENAHADDHAHQHGHPHPHPHPHAHSHDGRQPTQTAAAPAHTHDAAGDHEHHKTAHRDNNMRAAYVHVIADAAVSILAIIGLLLGSHYGWVWMDPAAGIVGALVIANWSVGLLRDTGGILLDMNPDQNMTDKVRRVIESDGDLLIDLHVWRLGPGHIGAIVSVATGQARDAAFYHGRLGHFPWLSHVTIEVRPHAPHPAADRAPS